MIGKKIFGYLVKWRMKFTTGIPDGRKPVNNRMERGWRQTINPSVWFSILKDEFCVHIQFAEMKNV